MISVLILVYAIVLLLAVLIADWTQRTVLSAAVIFLVAGLVAGNLGFGWISIPADSDAVYQMAEVALFSVLFTDGMRISVQDLRSYWQLPGRALFLGMPLVLLGIALLGHFLARLTWINAILLGAVLMPTDPVFASAIVGREEVPLRLRRLLNIESGLNDGLALPVVLVLLSFLSAEQVQPWALASKLLLGIGVGVGVAWIASWLAIRPIFKRTTAYEPLHIFAIGLLVFAVARLIDANLFLAAFSAGITVVSVNNAARDEFKEFGENIVELFKLMALLLFGALISWQYLYDITWRGYLLALLVILIVRPVSVWLALLGSRLTRVERLVAGWFGPKGFASVVYGLLILQNGFDKGGHLFHLIAVAVAGSILAHSSTDVIVVKWFRRQEDTEDR